jgi:hypothetical protein
MDSEGYVAVGPTNERQLLGVFMKSWGSEGN